MTTPGTIFTDRFDRRVYSELSSKSPAIQALQERGGKELPVFRELLMDLWAALYKADPLLKPQQQIRPVERPNRAVMAKLMETQQFPELRGFTTLDEFATTIALPILADAALKILEQKKQQMQKLQQQQQQADGQEQEANAAAQAASEAQGEADDKAEEAEQADGTPQAGQKQREAQQAQQKADLLSQTAQQAQMSFEEAQEKLEQQAESLMDELTQGQFDDQMRRAMRKAAKEALEKTEETSELLQAWGIEQGEIKQLSFEEKLALADQMRRSKKLQEIAKKAGRFRRLAVAKQKEKVSRRSGVVTNIKRGRDMRRLIPAERRALGHPFTRLQFLNRYATNSLFIYELHDEETKGEGPVIFCLDQSGSISEEQEIWMKALAIGAFQAAKQRGREFIYIHYGGPSDPLFVKRLKVGQSTYKDLLEIAMYSLGGGTDFEKPLGKSLEFIEAGLPADIVFCTDGQCAVRGEFLARFNKARREIPFHVISVLLTKGGATSSAAVQHFSDEMVDVQEMDAETAGQVYGAI